MELSKKARPHLRGWALEHGIGMDCTQESDNMPYLTLDEMIWFLDDHIVPPDSRRILGDARLRRDANRGRIGRVWEIVRRVLEEQTK